MNDGDKNAAFIAFTTLLIQNLIIIWILVLD